MSCLQSSNVWKSNFSMLIKPMKVILQIPWAWFSCGTPPQTLHSDIHIPTIPFPFMWTFCIVFFFFHICKYPKTEFRRPSFSVVLHHYHVTSQHFGKERQIASCPGFPQSAGSFLICRAAFWTTGHNQSAVSCWWVTEFLAYVSNCEGGCYWQWHQFLCSFVMI